MKTLRLIAVVPAVTVCGYLAYFVGGFINNLSTCRRSIAPWVISLWLLPGCAALNELPGDARAAFALKEPLASHTTRLETFNVEAKIDEAMSAAEYALNSSRFYVRPESFTVDRRCGEYTTGLNEWGMWSCFYFLPGKDRGTLQGRVIVESWNSLGVTTGQSWHSILAASFQNRVRFLQQK